MAKFVFGMNVSLDGYVDHDKFAPDAVLFRHWIEAVSGLAGSLYGRRLYEIMRYWEEDDPAWSADEREFGGGVAEPAEVGGVAVAAIGWPQRNAHHE